MHIALNAFFWNQPHTGSGQYVRQLVYHLNRYVSDLTITLVYPLPAGGQPPQDVPPSVKVHNVPTRPGHLGKVLFEQWYFPRTGREIGADLLHVPYWGSPLQASLPIVVTVHDLTTLLVPEYSRTPAARLYNALVSASARGATHIITDSLASQKDIEQHLAIPAASITPIYLGVGEEYTPDDNFLIDMAVKQKYNLPESYVLYLGGYALHKNVATLLLAYSYVVKGLKSEYPLLLAGTPPSTVSPQFPDYQTIINQLELNNHVRWLGFVDEADKPVVYRSASSFVFPSRYEGFGLPPLEAMACNVPVVTTNTPCLSEIVGDAAVTVEPDDERRMGGSIIATLIQEQLAQDLRQKGLKRAAEFTWQKTATQTLLVYVNALEKKI